MAEGDWRHQVLTPPTRTAQTPYPVDARGVPPRRGALDEPVSHSPSAKRP